MTKKTWETPEIKELDVRSTESGGTQHVNPDDNIWIGDEAYTSYS